MEPHFMDQQPSAPAYQPPVNQTAATAPAKNTRKILALWLLIGPTALIVSSIILYAVVNLITASLTPAPADGALISQTPVLQSIINIILFLVGVVSVIAWLPGIIAGIILFATQKKS
jgi:small-conductance mechanosensitive channel